MKLIINPNSTQMGPGQVRRLENIVGSQDVYITQREEELDDIIPHIQDDLIILAGGDGLFTTFCNRYRGDAKIGVLPLGGGNATMYVSGFDEPYTCLHDIMRGRYSTVKLPLIHVRLGDGTEEYTPLLSFGDDAEVLHRYKESRLHAFFGKHLGVLPGFAFETLRQIPKMASMRPDPNHKRHISTVAADGKQYTRPCNTVSIGTIPYFGAGFKALPLAGPKIHLRIFNQGVARFAWNFKGIWDGTFVNTDEKYPYLLDLVVEEGSIEMDKPTYCTTNGELRYKQKRVDFKLDREINLVVKERS